MPDLFDVVRAQRACRRFRPDPVPDDDLAAILDAAVHAPSAENLQPWVFVVVRDDAQRRAIGDLGRTLWNAGGRAFAEGRTSQKLFAEVDAAVAGEAPPPVVIVVAGDTREQPGGTRFIASSVFPAVQNLLLAAGALGYGTALTTLATVQADALAAVVELPEGIVPLAVVPLGRPARPLGPPRREPFTAKAHLDRYGTPLA